MLKEITMQELDPAQFISEKVTEIRNAVGEGTAINALSGGVDSSAVTILGHRALGLRLKSVFIDNGLMRQGEPEQVVALFAKMGVTVEVIDASREF
jgi:GMP synthase (glutamine-hydrolysing)